MSSSVQTVALLVVAIAFFGLVIARTWPRMGKRRNIPLGKALKAARTRIEAATTDAAKADALCEAADACALAFGRGEAAASYYFRAMRLLPDSVDLVQRAIQSLEHRPRVLEHLLWRRLGATGVATREVTTAILRGLVTVYAQKPRNAVRARAVENVLRLL